MLEENGIKKGKNMRKSIQNNLSVTCDDIDFTAVTGIQFYVRQRQTFFQYSPAVLSANEISVEIPEEDAVKFASEEVEMQFAFTDANGCPQASEIQRVRCDDFLKGAGYSAL